MHIESSEIVEAIAPVSTFPPSFDGNPITYGLALFSLTLISALCLAQLMSYWIEDRRLVQMGKLRPLLSLTPRREWTLLSVHRTIMAGLHLTILFQVFPDVLVMLAWGEASAETMDTLFFVDRIFDAAAMYPYLVSAALSSWIAQILPQRLVIETPFQLQVPRWWMIRNSVRITAVVSTIAIGVTIGKAGAAL